MVAGFANSNLRKLCFAKFVTFGNEVFVIAAKPFKENEDVSVNYKITRKIVSSRSASKSGRAFFVN